MHVFKYVCTHIHTHMSCHQLLFFFKDKRVEGLSMRGSGLIRGNQSHEALVSHVGGWETVVDEIQTNTLCRERVFGYRVYLVGYGGE